MKKIVIYLSGILWVTMAATNVQAESMRCGGQLAKPGDTKADIVEKCGEPVMTDHFCQPIASPTQIQATQHGQHNIQNNVVIQACEEIDIWTYHPAKGKFATHLYFVRGQLREMKYGDRVK